MTGANDREFVDTNILVYSLEAAPSAKRVAAKALLGDLWRRNRGALSVQVLHEFYVTASRKGATLDAIREALDYLREWPLHSPSRADVLAAIDLHLRYRISYWDTLVVHSARQLGCSILWTEDLSDGQRFGDLLVRNPFRPAPNGR